MQKNMTRWRMFYKIASLLYDFFPKRKNGKEMNMLMQLYPNVAKSSLKRDYEIGKLQRVFTIFFAGSIAAVILWIGEGSEELLVNNSYVLREKQGGEEKKVLLTAERENGEKVDTEIIVREKRFSDGDLEELYENMLQEVEKTALGENSSWDNIHKELCLVQQVEGYPFALSWESSDYRYVTNSGRIAQWREVKEMEAPCGLAAITLRAEYYHFVREHTFFARICPVEDETFAEKTENAIPSPIKTFSVVWIVSAFDLITFSPPDAICNASRFSKQSNIFAEETDAGSATAQFTLPCATLSAKISLSCGADVSS